MFTRLKFSRPAQFTRKHKFLLWGYLVLVVVMSLGALAPFAFMPFRRALLVCLLLGVVVGILRIFVELAFCWYFKPLMDKYDSKCQTGSRK